MIKLQNITSNKKGRCSTNSWRCTECQIVYKRFLTLQNHVSRVHPNKTDMIVNDRIVIPKARKYIKESSKNFQCNKCQRRFVSRFNYDNHQLTPCKPAGPPPQIWKCSECQTVLTKFYSLQSHVARLHPNKIDMIVNNRLVTPTPKNRLVFYSKMKFRCQTCPRRFVTSSGLEKHQRQPCKKSGPNFNKVLPSLSVAHDAPRIEANTLRLLPGWQCTNCDISYKCKRALQNHVFRKHPNKLDMVVQGRLIIPLPFRYSVRNKKLKCNKCNRRYVSSSALKKHEKTCKGKDTRTWQCTDCVVVFANRQALQYHIHYKHPNKKVMIVNKCRIVARVDPRRKVGPLKCPFCTRLLLTKHNLKLHVGRFHEGPRYKDKIKKQLLSRQSEKVLCDECRKPLSSLDNLRRHIVNQHANLLPYNKNGIFITKDYLQHCVAQSCPFCPSAMWLRDVPLHIKKKHVNKLPCFYKENSISVTGIEKRFRKCPECNVHLEDKTTLQQHVRMYHSSMLPYKVDKDYVITHMHSLKPVSSEHRLLHPCEDVQHCCPKCEFSNVSLTAYFIHLKLNHGDILQNELTASKNIPLI